jgi:hypothetical protein
VKLWSLRNSFPSAVYATIAGLSSRAKRGILVFARTSIVVVQARTKIPRVARDDKRVGSG